MKTVYLIIAILFFVGGAFLMWFVPRAWLGAGTGLPITLEIGEGWNASRVASALEEKGVIDSARGYRWYAAVDAAANRPKAGSYDIRSGMSYRTLARTFVIGPIREEVTIRVIEGWTIRDIREALVAMGVHVGDDAFDPVPYAEEFPFLKNIPSGGTMEGYLFPDTYRVWKDELPQGLIKKQLAEFAKNDAEYRTVILASIVEKEVKHDADRAHVAGIFLNRINDGMRLQSDATLNYILNTGRPRLTQQDLQTDSPYNTYLYAGFPPGPISNPGQASIDAALHPEKTDDLFFLSDDSGKMYYAKTLEQHIRNRQTAYGE